MILVLVFEWRNSDSATSTLSWNRFSYAESQFLLDRTTSYLVNGVFGQRMFFTKTIVPLFAKFMISFVLYSRLSSRGSII